jgi:hypothetical protein
MQLSKKRGNMNNPTEPALTRSVQIQISPRRAKKEILSRVVTLTGDHEYARLVFCEQRQAPTSSETASECKNAPRS